MPDHLTTNAGALPLQLAFDHALEYIAQPQSRVAGTATLDDLRSALGVDLTDTGLDPATVIEDLIEACKDGLNRSSGSRFFGWVIGGTLPAALAADLLTSAWDQNAATYAALRELGRNGIASLVDRCCRFATQLTSRIGELPQAKALNTPIINQGIVRFLNPSPTATVADHDTFTDQIITAICAEGTAFFTGTTFQGHRAMRISVCNWQTSDEDIDAVVSAIERVVTTAANQVAVTTSSWPRGLEPMEEEVRHSSENRSHRLN
jgi:glutamate/tyrosine decarboxylase-like PLP-dependent enzyme